jgi:hypothetical protein
LGLPTPALLIRKSIRPQRDSARSATRFGGVGQFRQPARVATDADDRHPHAGELDRSAEADPAAGAGDDRCLQFAHLVDGPVMLWGDRRD